MYWYVYCYDPERTQPRTPLRTDFHCHFPYILCFSHCMTSSIATASAALSLFTRVFPPVSQLEQPSLLIRVLPLFGHGWPLLPPTLPRLLRDFTLNNFAHPRSLPWTLPSFPCASRFLTNPHMLFEPTVSARRQFPDIRKL